jgi:hypothetical protein
METSAVCFDSLNQGDTASQILRMLPKLEELRRDDSPISCIELSSVSKNLVSLGCLKGFDFDYAQVDMSSMVFPRLERVRVESVKCSDLILITNVMENSIPQGRAFLKHLVLRLLDAMNESHHLNNLSVDYAQFCTSLSASLINIIEVRFILMKKASPELYTLALSFCYHPVHLEACFDAIFGLYQITSLHLNWHQVSLEQIKSALKKHGASNRWETFYHTFKIHALQLFFFLSTRRSLFFPATTILFSEL